MLTIGPDGVWRRFGLADWQVGTFITGGVVRLYAQHWARESYLTAPIRI